MLQVCLNGRRTKADSPHVPVTPTELAEAAAAAVAAGAEDIHLHPKQLDGRDTMDLDFVALALTAVRSVVDVPVGVTTGAWIDPDPANRIAAIRAWPVLPDHASVNWHEAGALEVTEALLERGIGVDVGVWAAPPQFEPEPLLWPHLPTAMSCRRVLVEANVPDGAVDTVRALLSLVGDYAPLLLHGEDKSAWPVLRLAQDLGLDTRIGLEDTLHLPDGTTGVDNAALVRAALKQGDAR